MVESSQRIVGIKEEMFVRFYEQSLFGWQQWVSKQDQLPTLKVLRKKVKKLNGREVLYGGLPIESLKQAGIDIGTEAVIELEIIIDFSEWESWRQEQRAQMDDIEEKLPCNPCDDDLLNRRYVRLFLPEAIVNKVMMTKASSSSSDWLLIAVKQAI
ncbi:hypothetical protein IB299_20080 [Vibrio parahaemolyticus]|uniref:Uncharacterized protein n=1 Tax=Vibrio parahaemolyticus TaxID=670 RepID=A0A9Q3UHJ9_VIBPH|nr:hypothetical protein [Vibrio parahaemolyticus]EGQ9132298.1 hypothetical protein [Vibrio parahaemolyticus]EGQ9152002.1 hypothetical protein [Vibrio parahaemolyticus]MCC3807923.1 hypothetical protein [Vibrio parahaemolyticus]MCC3831355.1 hypothetical protein [Vibrio parahaemolyticus]UPR17138.1 hypothetical protein H9J99_02740 [Vibrio parahaemolyticus]